MERLQFDVRILSRLQPPRSPPQCRAKSLAVLVACGLVFLGVFGRGALAEDAYMTKTQLLDPSCSGPSCATFEQSYVWINDTNYERGGPVILFVGGPSSKFNFQTRLSQFVKYCFMTRATFILLEHRFYGISLPQPQPNLGTGTDAASDDQGGEEGPFSTELLQYLTIENALADIQSFATYFQEAYLPAGTPWFLAGEAYGASLAAWFTTDANNEGTYSNLFKGTIASSAAIEARVDFEEYFQTLGEAVVDMSEISSPASSSSSSSALAAAAAAAAAAGEQCREALQRGTQEISRVLEEDGTAGRSAVAALFGACEATISPENEFFFKWAVSEVIASTLELNTPPVWSLNRTCAAAVDGGGGSLGTDPLSRALNGSAAAVQRAFEWNMNFEFELCLEECGNISALQRVRESVFRPLVKPLAPPPSGDSDSLSTSSSCVSFNESLWLTTLQNASNPERAWWWQRCSQLGWFHGTSAADPNQTVVFSGLAVERVVGYCASIFKIPGMSPNTDAVNAKYGGVSDFVARADAGSTTPPAALLFANANMDPLRVLAPNATSESRGFEVQNYVGGQNSFGFGIFASSADPPSLTTARDAGFQFLQSRIIAAASSTSSSSSSSSSSIATTTTVLTSSASPTLRTTTATTTPAPVVETSSRLPTTTPTRIFPSPGGIDVNDSTVQIILGACSVALVTIIVIIVVVAVRRSKRRAGTKSFWIRRNARRTHTPSMLLMPERPDPRPAAAAAAAAAATPDSTRAAGSVYKAPVATTEVQEANAHGLQWFD